MSLIPKGFPKRCQGAPNPLLPTPGMEKKSRQSLALPRLVAVCKVVCSHSEA